MANDDDRDDESEYLAQIVLRMRQMDDLNERFGPTRGRTRQMAALQWALDELRPRYPYAAVRALPIADRLERMLAVSRERRMQEEEHAS